MTVLLLADHDNKTLSGIVAKAMSAAKALGQDVHVLVAGADCKGVAEAAAKLEGAAKVLLADAPHLGHQLAEEMASRGTTAWRCSSLAPRPAIWLTSRWRATGGSRVARWSRSSNRQRAESNRRALTTRAIAAAAVSCST